jgi:hypothetical protein
MSWLLSFAGSRRQSSAIRRATRKHHAAEEKIRIVLDGLRAARPSP